MCKLHKTKAQDSQEKPRKAASNTGLAQLPIDHAESCGLECAVMKTGLALILLSACCLAQTANDCSKYPALCVKPPAPPVLPRIYQAPPPAPVYRSTTS